MGRNVIRPAISGLMGAYGAALYAVKKSKRKNLTKSAIISANDLKNFTHDVKAIVCKGCSNNCRLTINTFADGGKFIAGNRCEKPLGLPNVTEKYNMFEYKNKILEKYRENKRDTNKPTIGIPMALNMYELLPFWHTLFTELGFNVVVSPVSNRKLYLKGQHTIPSDTVCYPAKLVHGHIEALIDEKVDAVFYPGMSYNVDENLGDNHYNCPVVAYYPEVIRANVKALGNIKLIYDFVGLHNRKYFPKRIKTILLKYFPEHDFSKIKYAADKAYEEYSLHMAVLRSKAEEFIDIAKKTNMPIIVLSGRPYHIDPEINHGIDDLICSLGAVVITEDSISRNEERFRTTVLNQWTYHSRLYAAAKYVAEADSNMNINLVQLVSFGCGVDAITSDETRSIIENSGKIYTQIKIDEITNTGAVKIRLRSLFSVIGNGK
jgi:predicted nucleotide-binding protein (sugar kinase/HSP70/actin superfamily)